MGLAARPTPRLGPFDNRALIVALAVIAFLVLGAGGLFLAGNLARGGPGAPAAGPSAAPPASSPTPTLTPTPTPTPAPMETPTPSALAGLSCTLAVSGAWASGSGGFLTFPGGQFKPDPGSAVLTPDGQFYGLTHVLALHRWVAVPRDWVTPDGARYVYLGWDWNSQALRLVAPDNSISRLPLPEVTTASGARVNLSWKLLSAEADGVYLTAEGYMGQPGLYRVGYDGRSTRIAADSFWQAVGYGNAYGTVTASVPDGAANTIFRQSLAAGDREDVFSAPALASTVVGFDSTGTPVVEARNSKQVEVWLARPGSPVKLLGADVQGPTGGMGPGPAGKQPLHVYSAIGDTHGLWIATTQGLYLYTPEAGVEAASTVAGPLGSTCR